MKSKDNLETISRRVFLRHGGVAAIGIAIALPKRRARAAKPTNYEGLDSDSYLGTVQVLAKLEEPPVFTEGPAVDRAGNVFFTNVAANRILKFSPPNKQLTVFRENSHETNGLYFTPDGSLLACEGGTRRITRTDMKSGEISILADKYQGRPLAKPNDLCLDDSGRIYFSSRTASVDPDGENPKAVYRLDPNGTLTQLLTWPEIQMPNGLEVSPDNKRLYVIESHPDAERHRDIRAFDLDMHGNVSNGRVVIDFYPGRSGDGLTIDAEGNLYVAAGLHKLRTTSETLETRPGIHVISPAGKLLAWRETPEDTITNCAFGGDDLRTLYVTCGTLLLAIPTRVPGKASYRPRQ